MAPDFVFTESYSLPPDILHLMPDDDWLQGCPDIFGLDFAPAIDQALQSSVDNLVIPTGDDKVAAVDPDATVNDSARERHAIFQRSPWLCKPEPHLNAFSEHESFPLDEQQVKLASSPHQQSLPPLVFRRDLSARSRDRLFQLVVSTAESYISIPTFPSTDVSTYSSKLH